MTEHQESVRQWLESVLSSVSDHEVTISLPFQSFLLSLIHPARPNTRAFAMGNLVDMFNAP